MQTTIPHESTLDDAISLINEGYPYIKNRLEKYNTAIFETRLMGEKAACLHGADAAKLFYDNNYFWRKGAIPKRVQKTLMGTNGIQMQVDGEHQRRKALFMSFMSPDRVKHLTDLTLRYWRAYARKWEKMERVVLLDEASEVFCLAACKWAGVPLAPTEVRQRAQEYMAMIYGFGGVTTRYWRGIKARSKSEQWNQQVIQGIRSGKLEVPEASAAFRIAWFRDQNDELLDTETAAVELMNVVRPIVAIATYVAFSALALHEHPEQLLKLTTHGGTYAQNFVQEVRRLYPFTPFLGARPRKDFDWKGYCFKEGMLVLLDVYGLLHDPELWPQPYEFKPDRFEGWSGSPFDFIPQGGGDFETNHRCAGEWITIEAMKGALNFLTQELQYIVPPQDLRVDKSKMPTKPKSGFIITEVRYVGLVV
ncbi:cytochrome P450 [Pontibacter litorisediminis]|uniref:cytochrome P450 n=1 Tax=Pontibacter litorisediminis TaxID=1846260 RepID=UPI0023EAA79F|nr:cytochrome P450 [Pontibacter litorisediminis]